MFVITTGDSSAFYRGTNGYPSVYPTKEAAARDVQLWGVNDYLLHEVPAPIDKELASEIPVYHFGGTVGHSTRY